MSQLPADCLNEIFECLEEDKNTIHSCLLVNRLWCGVSVRILWTSVWNYDTLIACLSNESKEILLKNRIITPTPTSKPLFNYIAFIKNLEIDIIIKNILKNYQSVTPINLNYKKYLIAQEIYKLFDQISSLRKLRIHSSTIRNIPNVTPTIYLRTGDCLKHLSELSCRSDIYPEFFYQLSQICHNIQSLQIKFGHVISNGLTDLISFQKNLKHLDMAQYLYGNDLSYIIPSLTKHSNTLIKLYINEVNIPLSFIAKFTNLQELSFGYYPLRRFTELKYFTFPQLQILKFPYGHSSYEVLISLLENHGRNLKEFYVDYVEDDDNNLLNLTIAVFCPNLRKLYTVFKNNELDALKMVFSNCKYLESIKVRSGYGYLDTKELFVTITKYSQKYFHELRLIYYSSNQLPKKDLEEFLINWEGRIPLSLIIIIISYRLEEDNEIMEVVEKYKKLGIIKRFKALTYDDRM